MNSESGALATARTELEDLLNPLEGVLVYDHVPEELPTPCVVIDADDDYLSQGETYAGDEWWLGLKVYVLVDIASNAQATADLEALLDKVLPALSASEWELGPIGKPGPFHTALWLAHGVAITVRTLINLSTEQE